MMNYLEMLKLALPETFVVLAAFAALLVDMVSVREQPLRYRAAVVGGFACVGCVAAIAWILAAPHYGAVVGGMFVADPLTQLLKIVLLALAVLTLWVAVPTGFTSHVGEYFALMLLAVVGMMFLVSAENLLGIFLSLELTSLSLYILTAFNKRSLKSAEASLKYFLFGGMAAAFTLFGMSLLYGLTGEIELRPLAAKLSGVTGDPLFFIALAMTLVGFGFKIAVVPFHLWAPDAYEGAPAPSAALIAAGSKVASFFILSKVLLAGMAGAEGSGRLGHFTPGWMPLLATLALGSMIWGNLAAIAQNNVRRLLAYSAVAHAGYILLGILAVGHSGEAEPGMSALIYYLVIYGLTTVGAFAVVSLVEEKTGSSDMKAFAVL